MNNKEDLYPTVKNYQENQEDAQEIHADTKSKPNGKTNFKEKWKNPSYRKNVIRTIWLGASFLALGFAAGQRGPAFLDIQIITQTDVEEASFFFTASSIGYLVGSLVAGVIYDKLNKSMLLLLCVLGLGLSTIVLPWCFIYGLMIGIHVLVFIFGGGLDTAGNAELVRIWGKEGEMAMQFLHFAFAFGGVIGPIATEPFLTPNPEDDMNTSSTAAPDSTSLSNSTVALDFTDNLTSLTIPLTTDVHYAFTISGIITLLTALPLTVQLFSGRAEKRRQNKKDEKKKIKQPLPTGLFIFVQGTLCFFYLLYCAVEETFAAYLSTFVVKQLHWSKSKGAQLSSVYWASFATGRFLCIFVVHLMKSVKLLLFSCLALLISILAFLFFSLHNVNTGIWVTTVLVGAAMAPIFPTGFTWMEEEFVRVTGRVASSISISASSGGMINPVVLGYLMQQLTPMWFCYLFAGETVVCFCIFLFLLSLSRVYLQHAFVMQQPKSDEINIQNLEVDEITERNSAI